MCAWAEASFAEESPELDRLAETSTGRLPPLPDKRYLEKIMNSILLLLVTTHKEYSARTRRFLSEFGPLNEEAIVGRDVSAAVSGRLNASLYEKCLHKRGR